MGKLDGRVAIVTGGGRGIGKSIAIALAAEGAKVAVNYNTSSARAEQVVSEINAAWRDRTHNVGGADTAEERAVAVKADVSKPDEARQLIRSVHERWGRLDVLVNNAGITRDKSIRKMTDEDWLEVIQTNLNAVFFCTTAAMQPMIEQKYGRIINISSMNGQTSAFGQANYGASKGGIIAFSKTVALELAKFNVTVNVIAPGFTLTDMLAKVPETVQDQIKSKIPLGRFGMPEEIAKAVIFLAADADYITGAQINVNGGAYM
ncbi:MAG: 3-oxoacyl-ACP reductase FabG [Chloroflexales bacterium]|nr:3-oxoacyl-ACP reductase FabG [Chloroflexales bacterium]